MSMQADCVWPVAFDPAELANADNDIVAGIYELAARQQYDRIKQWEKDRAARLDAFWAETMEGLLKADIEALGLRPKTVAAYKRDFQAFRNFLESSEWEGYSMPSLPACPGSVAHWLLDRHARGASYQKLREICAAIGDAHRTAGHINPVEDILVTAALRYARRNPQQLEAVEQQEASDGRDA